MNAMAEIARCEEALSLCDSFASLKFMMFFGLQELLCANTSHWT